MSGKVCAQRPLDRSCLAAPQDALHVFGTDAGAIDRPGAVRPDTRHVGVRAKAPEPADDPEPRVRIAWRRLHVDCHADVRRLHDPREIRGLPRDRNVDVMALGLQPERLVLDGHMESIVLVGMVKGSAAREVVSEHDGRRAPGRVSFRGTTIAATSAEITTTISRARRRRRTFERLRPADRGSSSVGVRPSSRPMDENLSNVARVIVRNRQVISGLVDAPGTPLSANPQVRPYEASLSPANPHV